LQPLPPLAVDEETTIPERLPKRQSKTTEAVALDPITGDVVDAHRVVRLGDRRIDIIRAARDQNKLLLTRFGLDVTRWDVRPAPGKQDGKTSSDPMPQPHPHRVPDRQRLRRISEAHRGAVRCPSAGSTAREGTRTELPLGARPTSTFRVASGDYGNTSEYLRELIRRDREEQAISRLRMLVAEGLESGYPVPLTDERVDQLRRKALGSKR
jgi:antitoxin ParD1/3/4